MDNIKLGKLGENFAAEVLRAKGYRILKQNYRCKYGEIDIIATKAGELDFVEVKTRQSSAYGRPAEAVDVRKQKHIKYSAQNYINQVKNHGFNPAAVHFRVMEVMVEDIPNAY